MSIANSNLEVAREPIIEHLPQGRLRVQRWLEIKDRKFGRRTDVTAELFGGFGLLDGAVSSELKPEKQKHYPEYAFEDCHLIEEKTEEVFLPGGESIFQLYQVYETLTDTWALEDTPKSRTTESGLRVEERSEVAIPGSEPPYDEDDIGVETIDSNGKTLYLAAINDQSTERKGMLVTSWAEAGIIAMPERPGSLRMPGTRMITMVSQGLPFYPKLDGSEWTHTADELEAADGTKAKLVSKDDRNIEGFMQFNRTYLVAADPSGTITGQKYSVPSKTRVQGLGIVTPLTDNISMTNVTGGTISGTRATYRRTPPRSSWVDVDYTLEITTSPPPEVARAFDATLVSCGIKEERLNLRGGPGTSVTFGASNNKQTVTGFSRAFSASVRHEDLFGYYLAAGAQAGSLQYVAAEIPRVVDDAVSTPDEVTVKEQTSVVVTGDTNGNAYTTTGIVDQKARPVFVTYDGTVYWEVLKWTAT